MSGARAGGRAAALACVTLLSACAANPGMNAAAAAKANANLGADYLRKNANEAARRYFHKALDYDDDNFSANWGMAVVDDRLSHPDKARSYYKKALHLRASPAVFNSYAAFLCRHGETGQALSYFQRAAAAPRYGDKANALANAGLCAQRAGRDDAAAYYRRALAVDPKQATALARLAKLEYARGDYLNARAFLERVDAVTDLDAGLLLLAARIELALHDRAAAKSYLKRHNASRPAAAVALSQLQGTRS